MKRSSIQIKVISLILLIMTITITVVLIITLNNHREDLIESNENTLSVNTSILNTAIRNIMLSGEAPIATKTLEDLQSLNTLNNVDIYRVDGTPAFSDYSTIDSVNNYQKMFQFEKTERIMGGMEDNSNFQMVLNTRTPQINELVDTRELEYYFPILNYKDCRVCHGEDEFIRGVVHLKISLNSVYKTVRSSTILTIILFIGVGLMISLLLFISLKRVVLSPLNKISYVVNEVGDGNLEEVVHLKSHDELGLLGRAINSMISGLKERNRLQIENSVIEAQNRENRKYLDNIQEGLVLLDKEDRITSTYSQFFTKLFNIDAPEGQNIGEIIYPNGVPDEFIDFMGMLRDNLLAEMDMLMEINPVQGVRVDLGDHYVIIDAFFARITGASDEVENIMVIFKDRTTQVETERRLEEEKLKTQNELEIISVMLKSGIDDVQKLLNNLELLKSRVIDVDDNSRDEILRDLHTIKGEVNYLGFLQLGSTIHQMEDDLIALVDGKTVALKIEEETDLLRNLLSNFSDFDGGSSSNNSLKLFISRLPNLVEELSEKLNKEVELHIHSEVEEMGDFEQLKGALIHLIRNAIDHGIEDRYERVARSKGVSGRLDVNLLEDSNSYIFEIGDDGSGLNFSSIELIARTRGLISKKDVSHSDLTKVIFKPGFSSQDSITEVSGRGYGLDAVKDAVDRLNGSITIKNYDGRGTTFILTIPKKGEVE